MEINLKNKYDFFSDIDHYPLRMYNCSVYATNLLSDVGPNSVKEYLESFSTKERAYMYEILRMVKLTSAKNVQAMVTKGLEFSNDDWVAVNDAR